MPGAALDVSMDCAAPCNSSRERSWAAGSCAAIGGSRAAGDRKWEKNLVRHFLSNHQPIGEGGLDNAYWLQGAENPADGLTKVRSATAPRLRLLESRRLNPGSLRPLQGVVWAEGSGHL